MPDATTQIDLTAGEPLITIKEAAKVMQCGYSTARDLIINGHIPSTMSGRRLKTTASACQAYAESAKDQKLAANADRPAASTSSRPVSEQTKKARIRNSPAQQAAAKSLRALGLY